MESEERKQRFIKLLSEMLLESNGIKSKLAQKLGIKAPTLTGWFQGKVDPASLDIRVFERIAKVRNCSVDDLAKLLSLFDDEPKNPLDKLKNLITEMLADTSLEQLGQRLGISKSTIGGWLYPGKNIDPGKLSAGTIAILAREKKWTIERLLTYLDLKEPVIKNQEISKVQSELSTFSLIEQIEILSWLSALVEEKLKYSANIKEVSKKPRAQLMERNPQVLILIESEDVSLASLYSSNLAVHLHLQPENIKIATPSSMPESLEHFDVLIFDINSQQSPCIPLLESLQFEGDIVIFADASLPDDVRERLNQKATELIVKPVPWEKLKDLAAFS